MSPKLWKQTAGSSIDNNRYRRCCSSLGWCENQGALARCPALASRTSARISAPRGLLGGERRCRRKWQSHRGAIPAPIGAIRPASSLCCNSTASVGPGNGCAEIPSLSPPCRNRRSTSRRNRASSRYRMLPWPRVGDAISPGAKASSGVPPFVHPSSHSTSSPRWLRAQTLSMPDALPI